MELDFERVMSMDGEKKKKRGRRKRMRRMVKKVKR